MSTHDWGQVSTARGLYYYIESQYQTHEVNTHHWGQVSTANGLYYYIESQYLTHEVSTHPWGQDPTARGHYYYIESHFLTPWWQYTWLRQSFYCKRSVLLHWVPFSNTLMWVHMTEAKFLLLEVCTTTLSPSIRHMKSIHITEAKFLLLMVCTTTWSPSIWHMK